MGSRPPDGDPAPSDGRLPEQSTAGLGSRPFGVYLHVPFCATRCGYCDFNTYTAGELGSSTGPQAYVDAAVAEVRLARQVLGRPVAASTVFVGGGTPTLLPVADLGRLLRAVEDELGLEAGAEVTTEANPESVDARSLVALREAGFTRISFGMQSAVPHVLAALDRVHTPGRALEAVAEARAAGFEHVNVDLIYGTPGESDEDWQASLDAVVGTGADHVSAYALIVEEGTRLARQIARGERAAPDDDVLADRYLMAEETLSSNGFGWYEVSNWARSGEGRCRHNELYWRNDDWWGVGPGAHSHVGGTRWWNVRHPAAYAQRLDAGESPAQAREVLDEQTRRVEAVMLQLRLEGGLATTELDEPGILAGERQVAAGLLDASSWAAGRASLTLRGRLLADLVVRELLG